ncbi:hypothetical protein EVA_08168 [gut metagenome]|uniref:Uncharacterized protein n=1 Tax=gut metagenome TaxID=749906 RepID=J9GTN3_9ZZZZ
MLNTHFYIISNRNWFFTLIFRFKLSSFYLEHTNANSSVA